MWIVLLLRHAFLFSFLNYPFPQHCWKGYIVKVLFMRQFRFIILWSTIFIPRLMSALVTSEIQIRKWHCGHFKHYSNMKFNIKPIRLFIHLLLSFLPALSAHTSHALAVIFEAELQSLCSMVFLRDFCYLRPGPRGSIVPANRHQMTLPPGSSSLSLLIGKPYAALSLVC